MLPKIDVPIYDVKLPLLNKKFRFRPFLVKEEKILLMAMESDDEKSMLTAIKQIINNCCLDEIDVDQMPLGDLEFFFLNLRARSIGEIVDLQYKCNNPIDDDTGEQKSCGNIVKFQVNVLEIDPKIPEGHTNKIELSSNMGVVMKYPNFKSLEMAEGNETENEIEKLMSVICDCIDYIYDSESIYYSKDIQRKEMMEFIDGLTREQFEKIKNFFDTLPKISKDLDFKCEKCGHNEKVTVEGLQNFFA